MRSQRNAWLVALSAASVALSYACAIAAQSKPTLSGSWSASGVSESWSFDNWVDACGPKPKGQGGGGGAVQIREQGGELSIVGAGRAFSTSECWEQSPGLGRVSHSQSGGGRFWRTRCSATNDKERVSVTTTLSATDSTIAMNEVSEHKVTVSAELVCTATASRSRSYSLNKRDGEEAPPAASASASASASAPPLPTQAPSASAPATQAEPKKPPKICTSPGEPARLEVYPARKTLRPGDRFSFRTVVVDAEGCALSTKPTWSISPTSLAAKVSVDGSGTVIIKEDAQEGRVELLAAIAGKSVPIFVEVTSAASYEALLSAGKLDPQGPEQGAVVVIATGAIGGRGGVADDVGRERKRTFLVIVVALAALLGFAGLALLRRGRRPRNNVENNVEEGIDDETEASPEAEAEAEALAEAEAHARAETDAEAEASMAAQPSGPAAARPPAQSASGKVCPTCGERYSTDAEFCGRDGTILVPLNC